MDLMTTKVVLPVFELARRFGVDPSRVIFKIEDNGQAKGSLVLFHCWIDGKDLSPAQEKILTAFLQQYAKDEIEVIGIAKEA